MPPAAEATKGSVDLSQAAEAMSGSDDLLQAAETEDGSVDLSQAAEAESGSVDLPGPSALQGRTTSEINVFPFFPKQLAEKKPVHA